MLRAATACENADAITLHRSMALPSFRAKRVHALEKAIAVFSPQTYNSAIHVFRARQHAAAVIVGGDELSKKLAGLPVALTRSPRPLSRQQAPAFGRRTRFRKDRARP